MLKVIELVEAGQLDLAKDYTKDAKEELLEILEFGTDKRSHDELGSAIPGYIADWYSKDPNYPGSHVSGLIIIADIDIPNGNRLSIQTTGSMNKPGNRIGVLQMVTSGQMDEHLS
jgi:hypothetical protein